MLRGVRKVDVVIGDCRQNGGLVSHRSGVEASPREERGCSGRMDELRPEPLTERISFKIQGGVEMRSGREVKGLLGKYSQRGSLHQTKISVKPTVPVSCRNKQNNPLGAVRTIGIKARPYPVSKFKGSSQVSSANCIAESPQETIVNSTMQMEREESGDNDSQLELQGLMRRSYELKIVELEEENQKCFRAIAELQDRLRREEVEKGSIEMRIDRVERELISLQSDYSEIHLQNSIIENSVSSEAKAESTQTDLPKPSEQKSVQTIEVQPTVPNGPTPCQLPCLDSEDWFSRARYYQLCFQQQKLQGGNRQKEWKLQWENVQIEWRLRVEGVQRQLSQLRGKYEGKCQQVREKEGLINRLILPRQ